MMRKAIVLAAIVALCSVASGQNLFQNPGFETGNFTGWTVKPTVNGTSNPPETVVMYDIDGPGPLPDSLAARFAVGQVTFQSGVPAGMELTQSLALTGGQQYQIDFDLSTERKSATGNASGGIFDLIVNGNSIAQWDSGSIGGTNPWNKYFHMTANFTPATSGNYDIGLRIQRPYTTPGDVFQYVDNAVAIPEPAALGLLALGLLLRRR